MELGAFVCARFWRGPALGPGLKTMNWNRTGNEGPGDVHVAQTDWLINRAFYASELRICRAHPPLRKLSPEAGTSSSDLDNTTMSAQCCVPAPPSHHAPSGHEEIVASLTSYVVSPASPTASVLLISDIFGFDGPLLRKLADKIASHGYYVVVPDLLDKDPYVPLDPNNPFGNFGPWIQKHKPSDVTDNVKGIIEAVNDKGFSSVGIVGFCWGAKVAVHFAKGDLVKAAVFCHPSFVTVEDIQEVKIPTAILAAEIDQTTPPALAQQFADILAAKTEVDSFVHIYPGVEHGWTCRYDADNQSDVEKADEAHSKLLEWFGKHL